MCLFPFTSVTSTFAHTNTSKDRKSTQSDMQGFNGDLMVPSGATLMPAPLGDTPVTCIRETLKFHILFSVQLFMLSLNNFSNLNRKTEIGAVTSALLF